MEQRFKQMRASIRPSVYKRAEEQIDLLSKEVEELMAKAEQADSTPLDDGLSIPDEIVRRKDRIERLKEARHIIEKRDKEAKQSKYDEKVAKREAQRKAGKKAKRSRTKEAEIHPGRQKTIQLYRPREPHNEGRQWPAF